MGFRAGKEPDRSLRSAVVGSVLGALALLTPSVWAQPTIDDSDPSVSWQRLDFQAKKLFWTATTQVELSWPTESSVQAELLTTPARDGLSPLSPVALLTTRSAFGSRSDQVEVWFEPGTGRALQRRKARHGSKAYHKTYRFTDDGVFSHRVSPGDGEHRSPVADWSQIDDSTIPQTPDRCAPVIEPTALLHRVSAADLEIGDQLELCSFSNKRTKRIVVRVEDCVRMAVDHRLVAADGTVTQRQETLEALRIRIGPASSDAEGFEFLGLEGAVKLFVDLEHRLPVRLEGRLGALGRLRVELDAAHLAAHHP